MSGPADPFRVVRLRRGERVLQILLGDLAERCGRSCEEIAAALLISDAFGLLVDVDRVEETEAAQRQAANAKRPPAAGGARQ